MFVWPVRPASTARLTAQCAAPHSTRKGGTRGSAGAGGAGITATIPCEIGMLGGTALRPATSRPLSR
eukprot:10854217-Alexandrium_andersonii.AAC.1